MNVVRYKGEGVSALTISKEVEACLTIKDLITSKR